MTTTVQLFVRLQLISGMHGPHGMCTAARERREEDWVTLVLYGPAGVVHVWWRQRTPKAADGQTH